MLLRNPFLIYVLLFLLGFFLSTCHSSENAPNSNHAIAIQDSTDAIHSITGLEGPEAVRYLPSEDVFFIANWKGGGNERDRNGFISKISPTGKMLDRKFITGTPQYPLHAPRGMYISNDKLWVADIDGVHLFDPQSGEHLSFFDFTDYQPGFINDISAGADSSMYITDTGASRVYQIRQGKVTVIADSLPVAPNGITFNTITKEVIIVPWNGDSTFYKMPADKLSFEPYLNASGGFFDGVELLGSNIIVASQADSSIRMLGDNSGQVIIKTPGRPADIAIDPNRKIIAVPYIALNRVDIWKVK